MIDALRNKLGGLFGGAAKLAPALTAAPADPDTDGGAFVAGPPGWIPVFALAGVFIYASGADAWKDPHKFLMDNGGTVATALLGMGSLFAGYRGHRGYLKAKVAIAAQQASAANPAQTPDPPAQVTP